MTINRSLAIIKPKQPFVDWANQLPDAKWETSFKDLQDDCTAFLIPEYDSDFDARMFIEKHCSEIFEDELFSWCTNEDWWPKIRTNKVFWEWFDVDLHSEIIDLVKKSIIRDED